VYKSNTNEPLSLLHYKNYRGSNTLHKIIHGRMRKHSECLSTESNRQQRKTYYTLPSCMRSDVKYCDTFNCWSATGQTTLFCSLR